MEYHVIVPIHLHLLMKSLQNLILNVKAQRNSFVNGIFETLIKVSKNPTIGMPDVRYNKKRSVQYRSFLSHPKYRIIYRVTKTSIRIVAIQCNLMEA